MILGWPWLIERDGSDVALAPRQTLKRLGPFCSLARIPDSCYVKKPGLACWEVRELHKAATS